MDCLGRGANRQSDPSKRVNEAYSRGPITGSGFKSCFEGSVSLFTPVPRQWTPRSLITTTLTQTRINSPNEEVDAT